MPSVDFKAVRELVSMAQVLGLLKFQACEKSGDQVRGACPLHDCSSENGRTLSAHLRKNAYRCFKCGPAGNQLDLWAAANGLSIHAAAIDLCQRLQVEPPKPSRDQSRLIVEKSRTEKRNP